MKQFKLKKCKRVHGIHFAPDGSRLLAVGGEEVRMIDCAVWLDLAAGETTGRVELLAQCYAVPPDVDRYIVGGANQWKRMPSVAWMDLTDAKEWRGFPPPTRSAPPSYREVSALAFDSFGARLAICHARRSGTRSHLNGWQTVTIVARDSGIADARIEMQTDVGVLAFNADGARLSCTGGVGGDSTACVYDTATGSRVFAFEPPSKVSRCVQFLSDNRLVVANGSDVFVLPPDGGAPVFALKGHPKQVNAVALTPDGKRLLTASHDGSIRTWDANTGEPGPAFDWNIGTVTAVSFSPDGLTCAAAGQGGKIVLWDVDG